MKKVVRMINRITGYLMTAVLLSMAISQGALAATIPAEHIQDGQAPDSVLEMQELSEGGILAPLTFSEEEIASCEMTEQELISYAGVSGETQAQAWQELEADLMSLQASTVSVNSSPTTELSVDVVNGTVSGNSEGELQDGEVDAQTLGYATIADAASYLRKQMVQRKSYIILRLAKGNDSAQRSIRKILEQSMAYDENGLPVEGDYLYWNFMSYRWALSNVTDETVTFRIAVLWRTNASEEKYVTQKVAQIIRELDLQNAQKSEYEKVRLIYTYIMDHVSYDYYHYRINQKYMPMYTAYAALHDGTGVCQAYSLLFYRICEEAGISARLIAGNDDGNGRPTHGWNIVRIGEYYYNVDATWDDETISRNLFFLKNEKDFMKHTRNKAYLGTDFEQKYPTSPVSYRIPDAIDTVQDTETDHTQTGNITIAGSLLLEQSTNNRVRIAWTAMPGAQRYYVYRKSGVGDYGCVGTTTDTSYVNQIPGEGRYTYVVYASDGTDFIAAFSEKEITCNTILPKKGKTYQVDGCRYKILKSTASVRTVAFAGITAKNATSVVIPDRVKIDGLTYKVTEISAGALRQKTKVKTVSIGKNINKIGKNAFYGCKKLVQIVVQGKNIKSVGKAAFAKTGSRANVYVPSSSLKKYKKLFAGKGLSKKARIRK